jgi:serine/threonine protein kinase
MHDQLLVIAGPDEGRVFALDGSENLLVGRHADVGVRLSDVSVSRTHCGVRTKGNYVELFDYESKHGTFVNGKRVRRHKLHPGDVIRIGQTELRYVREDKAEPSTLAPASRPSSKDPTAADPLAELVGKTLAQYEVGPLLAKGRSGAVFQARDTEEERVIALKVLWPQLTPDVKEKQRFIRAMKTVMPLQHPNLVTVYNAGKTGMYRWIAMELVHGKNLKQVVQRIGNGAARRRKKRKWSPTESSARGWWMLALRVAVHVGRALEFAHENQIVHRNVTPQNILIRSIDHVAKLGDLMLAKALEGPLASQVTLPNELLGEVEYMSPERTFGSANGDGRSDLYSLGAVVYAVVAGQPPFVASTRRETLAKIREADPVPLKTYEPSTPVAFEEVVMTLLRKQPEGRFQTADQMLLRLESIAKEYQLRI